MNNKVSQAKILILILCLLISFVVSQSDFTAVGGFLQTATLTPNKTSGTAPLLVNFNVQVGPASDSGCAQASYILSFGDGQSAQGAGSGNVNHVYNSAGEYDAMLVYTREENVGAAAPDCRQQQASDSVRITAIVASDPSEPREPMRYIGTDSNWYNPDNWDQGRVPGPDDDVQIDGGMLVIIDPEQDPSRAGKCQLQDFTLENGARVETRPGVELVVENLEIGTGSTLYLRSSHLITDHMSIRAELAEVQTNREAHPRRLMPGGYNCSVCGLGLGNPSLMQMETAEFENAALSFFLGGPEPATAEELGRGYYANLIATSVVLGPNTNLQFELIYDFVPKAGDRFVIVEASESLTGTFEGFPQGAVVGDIGNLAFVITYEGNQIVLTAEAR